MANYSHAGPLAVGTTTPSGTITFNDAAAAPWERWGGHAFSLGGTATATNLIGSGVFNPGTVSSVLETNDTNTVLLMDFVESNIRRLASGSRNRRFASVTNIRNTTRSTVDRLRAIVYMRSDHPNAAGWNTVAPSIVSIHPNWRHVETLANVQIGDGNPYWEIRFHSRVPGGADVGYPPAANNDGPTGSVGGPPINDPGGSWPGGKRFWVTLGIGSGGANPTQGHTADIGIKFESHQAGTLVWTNTSWRRMEGGVG